MGLPIHVNGPQGAYFFLLCINFLLVFVTSNWFSEVFKQPVTQAVMRKDRCQKIWKYYNVNHTN